MKKLWIMAVAMLLILSLVGCSADTFTVNSTSKKFKPRTVTGITLYGPDPAGQTAEGITQELTPGTNPHYERILQLVEGKKEPTCPTNNFGLCYISFSFRSGDVTKVYPANDGSHYLCLYSLNQAVAQYVELTPEAMAELTDIIETYQIQVDYSNQ